MRRSIALALSLLGLFDSLYLLYTYASPSRPMLCLGTGCDAVRASAYSTLGGVSMPVFGVLGYALLAIVLILEAVASARFAKIARYAWLAMAGCGFLFSLYLEYLQAFVIHAYCAWCITSGLVMTALFVLGILNVTRSGPEPDPAMQLRQVRGLLAICAAGLVVGGPAFYLLAREGDVPADAPVATAADLAARLVRSVSHTNGNAQAPLTVVEFGDFECPVCGRGEAAARKIRARYAGRVRFVFRQFPLERIHPRAFAAAQASECAAEQGKFWEMVEKIYEHQSDLSAEGLRRDSLEVGLDAARFDRCLADGAAADRVRRDMEDGRALGVRATPTFFIGQQKVEGVLTEAQFASLLDAQLPPAAPAPPAEKVRTVKRDPPPAAPPATLGGFGPGLQTAAPGGLLSASPAGAGCNEADANKQQPALIQTQELRQLLPSKPVFVDVRPAAEYAAGHIPDAISLPVDEIAQRWSTLPKDRTIVLYESGRSSGDVCAASRSAGRALLERGFPFSQVKVYQDGLAGWDRR